MNDERDIAAKGRWKSNIPANPYQQPKKGHDPIAATRKSKPPAVLLASEEAAGDKPPGQQPATVAAAWDGSEPVFSIRASDPLCGPIVRFWANASKGYISEPDFNAAHDLASGMDEWRKRNSGAG